MTEMTDIEKSLEVFESEFYTGANFTSLSIIIPSLSNFETRAELLMMKFHHSSIE